MTPEERHAINIEALGSEKAYRAWIAVTDALQKFAHTQRDVAGTSVQDIYDRASERCFRAQSLAARAPADGGALSRPPQTASQVPGTTPNPSPGET